MRSSHIRHDRFGRLSRSCAAGGLATGTVLAVAAAGLSVMPTAASADDLATPSATTSAAATSPAAPGVSASPASAPTGASDSVSVAGAPTVSASPSTATTGVTTAAPGSPSATVPPNAGPVDASPKPDSASAAQAAKATGKRVEDVSQATPYSNVYANPDGSWTEQTSPVPFQTHASDGAWQPIDTDLTTTGDGSLAPANTLNNVSFSDGGNTTVASMNLDGQSLGWTWAANLPKPSVSGPSATYQITSTEQLVLTATPTGFSEDIVLSAPPTSQAAATFTLPIQTGTATLATDGATAAQGAVISDASGKNLLWAAPPTAYDSSTGSGPQGAPSSSKVSLGAGAYLAGGRPAALGGGTAGTPGAVGSGTGKVGLSLTPDWSWLTAKSTVYPVTIDPSFSSVTSGDTWANSKNTTTNYNGNTSLQAGDNTTQTWVARTFLHFDNTGMANINGKTVTSATLQMQNIQSNSCTGAVINAQRISADWNANTLDWANQPAVASWTATFSPAYGYTGCGSNAATWDVTPIVQAWATGANTNYGIRIAAATETNAN
jgi:hypothetical protein